MKGSMLIAVALCCLVSLALADYGYGSYDSYGSYGGGYVPLPYYGQGVGTNNNTLLAFVGLMVLLVALFTTLNTNNTRIVNLTSG